jgi:hypothetical protein
MGAVCCSKQGEESPTASKNSKRLKGSAKDFDSDRVAQEILFEMETKDRELDQRDQDALREITAKKEVKKGVKTGEYKGWKKKESSIDFQEKGKEKKKK